MQLEVGGDDGGCEFGVGGGSSSCTPDLRSNEVKPGVLVSPASKAIYPVVEMGPHFSQFLSATMGPLVARVSAAITTPPSNRHPTMVVPVEVAFGSGTPCACSAVLRLCRLKSKPPMVLVLFREVGEGGTGGCIGWICESVVVYMSISG